MKETILTSRSNRVGQNVCKNNTERENAHLFPV